MLESSIPPVSLKFSVSAEVTSRLDPSAKPILSAIEQTLRTARALHRAAKGATVLQALPAVRRAHNAGVFSGLAVSALYRQRHLLQRKHFLQTLSFEAGFKNWEAFSRSLRSRIVPNDEQHCDVTDFGYPNLWFSTHAQASIFADENGGRVVPYGAQAMVVMPQFNNNISGSYHA